MKNSLKIRLQRIENQIGNPFSPRGIFLQTKEVNGKRVAWLIDIPPNAKGSSFCLGITLPVKDKDDDSLETHDPYFHRVTEDYLIKQPAIAKLLREKGYI